MEFFHIIGHYWWEILAFVFGLPLIISAIEFFHGWTLLLNVFETFFNTHFGTHFEEKTSFKTKFNSWSWEWKTYRKWLVITALVTLLVVIGVSFL